MRRCFAWPLFPDSPLPPVTSIQRRLNASLFQRGARYLGDEDTMLRPALANGRGGGGVGGAAQTWGSLGVSGDSSPPWIELAVMGRSNVGKSTLLNALLGGRAGSDAFVPVSKRPGTTARLDFYGVGSGAAASPLVLVDTPGYGFSSRGKASSGAWMARISGYLRTRRALNPSGLEGAPLLARVLVLVDARLGVTPQDAAVLAALDEARLPCWVALSKADLVGGALLEDVAARTRRHLAGLRMPFPVLNAVSAATGAGMLQLQLALLQVVKLHRLTAEDAAAHKRELDGGDAEPFPAKG
jgi:GTP-binding protein